MIDEMTEQVKEPDWDILINFGMPVNIRHDTDDIPGYDNVVRHIIYAAGYLVQNEHPPHNGRYYDSFKALLLALKTHYPSEFRRIEQAAGLDFVKSFDLNSITGRHIKLRNISLALISRYYRQQGIF